MILCPLTGIIVNCLRQFVKHPSVLRAYTIQLCTRQKIVLIKVIKTLAIVANNITIVNRKIAKI